MSYYRVNCRKTPDSTALWCGNSLQWTFLPLPQPCHCQSTISSPAAWCSSVGSSQVSHAQLLFMTPERMGNHQLSPDQAVGRQNALLPPLFALLSPVLFIFCYINKKKTDLIAWNKHISQRKMWGQAGRTGSSYSKDLNSWMAFREGVLKTAWGTGSSHAHSLIGWYWDRWLVFQKWAFSTFWF